MVSRCAAVSDVGLHAHARTQLAQRRARRARPPQPRGIRTITNVAWRKWSLFWGILVGIFRVWETRIFDQCNRWSEMVYEEMMLRVLFESKPTG